ncbi:MAG: hypothetical protein EZS28_042594 [Streblomastix strix]|uniref:Reverse transcriptase domain-containing protein n=1 Tax=Streblomastix strix TaxID=222440 RepID=A0A5J4TV28_9EUKA|nr:MAG: hypothetical protein EZS28_042594 [Streblomastix strix]
MGLQLTRWRNQLSEIRQTAGLCTTSKEGTLPLEDMNLSNVAVPDRLIARIQQWEKIGGAKNILIGAQPSWITPQAPLLLQSLKQPRQFKGTQEQMIEYQNKLTEELSQGIVKESMKIKVHNPIFLVSRSDDRPRKIIRCRKLNSITQQVHFQMEGIQELKQIIEQWDFATTLDLKNAFHHIKVNQKLQTFFGFKFQNRSYCYVGLPFG